MSTPSRWLNWTPSQRPIMETSPELEPTKPSKVASVGFDGSVSGENPIIRPSDQPEQTSPIMEKALYTEPTKPSEVTELSPLAGRKNYRGQMVLTVEDLPELENRLRAQGWKVKRQGLELVCTSPGPVAERIQ